MNFVLVQVVAQLLLLGQHSTFYQFDFVETRDALKLRYGTRTSYLHSCGTFSDYHSKKLRNREVDICEITFSPHKLM